VRPAPTMRFDAPVFVTDRQIPLRWDALPAFGPITGYDTDEEIWTGEDEEEDEEDAAVTVEPWRVAKPTTEGCSKARRARAIAGRLGRTTRTAGSPTGPVIARHSRTTRARSSHPGTGRRSGIRATTWARRSEPRSGVARLTIDVDTFGLAILATTCPDCGRFRVVAGGDDEEGSDTDLRSNGRQDRAVVWHWDNGQEGFFAEEGNGHVVLEVTSNARPVIIDGMLQGPSLDEEGMDVEDEDP
jgi:hypothetical protein